MRVNRYTFLFLFISSIHCNHPLPFHPDAKSKNDDGMALALITAGFDLQTEARIRIGSLPSKSPGSENDTASQIALGEKIFKDKSLSLNSVQSCSTCHILDGKNGGADGQSTSRGTFGQIGRRNSPSIFNVGFLETLFWDGRKSSLSDQALLPFVDQSEMALASTSDLINRLNAKSEYSTLFASAFPENPAIQLTSIKSSISAFGRSLVSSSRFDEFVNGNPYALSVQEKEGLRIFLSFNCTNCHSGYMLGGNKFIKLDSRYSYNSSDFGRYEFTGVEADRYFFRTPSLRNVALTSPYFHDGSVSTLEEAVRRMNEYEAPRTLSDSEILSLVTFLKSLSDRVRSTL
jgi:cytochrome c peroxidase